MKYVEHRMSVDTGSPANSVQTWLGKELEVRGIDAVIYTRYILSILQQDSFDMEHSDAHFFPPSKKGSQQQHHAGCGVSVATVLGKGRGCSLAGGGGCNHGNRDGKQQQQTVYKHGKGMMDSEERKKCAAVECLLSVSDEDAGIERLVEELYHKLKEHNSDEATASPLSELEPQLVVKRQTPLGTPEDPAEKYYAAFPPLKEPEDGATVVPSCICENQKLWSRLAQKLQSAEKQQSPIAPQTGSNVISSKEKNSIVSEHSRRKRGDRNEDGDASKKPVSVLMVNAGTDKSAVDGANAVKFFKYGSCERCVHLKSLLGMSMSPDPEDVDVGRTRDSSLPSSPRSRRKHSPGWKDVNAERPVFVIPKVNGGSDRKSPGRQCEQPIKSPSENTRSSSPPGGWKRSTSPLQRDDVDRSVSLPPDSEDEAAHEVTETNPEDSSWYTNPFNGLFCPLPPRKFSAEKRVEDDEVEAGQMSSFQPVRLYNHNHGDMATAAALVFPSFLGKNLFTCKASDTEKANKNDEDTGEIMENKSKLLKFFSPSGHKEKLDDKCLEDKENMLAYLTSSSAGFLSFPNDRGDQSASSSVFPDNHDNILFLQPALNFSSTNSVSGTDGVDSLSDFAGLFGNTLFPSSSLASNHGDHRNGVDLMSSTFAHENIYPHSAEEGTSDCGTDPNTDDHETCLNVTSEVEPECGVSMDCGEHDLLTALECQERKENKPEPEDTGDGTLATSPFCLPRLFETSRLLKLFQDEDEDGVIKRASESKEQQEEVGFLKQVRLLSPGRDIACFSPINIVPSFSEFCFESSETCLPDVMLMSSETVDSDSGIADDKPSGDDDYAAGTLSNATDDDDETEVDDLSAACDVDRLVSTPGVVMETESCCGSYRQNPCAGAAGQQVDSDGFIQQNYHGVIQIQIPPATTVGQTQIDSDASTPKVSYIELPDDFDDMSDGSESLMKPVWHSDHTHTSVWESKLLDLDNTAMSDLRLTLDDLDFCDKCHSNRSSSARLLSVGNSSRHSGTGHTPWQCCRRHGGGGALTPTNVHSYSTWYDLHATDSTYDDDRPLKDLLETILSSPPKKCLQGSHSHLHNSLIPTSSSSSSPSSSYVHHAFHQLWDVKSQTYHSHDFAEQSKERPPMVEVIKENVLGFGALNWSQLSSDLFIQGGVYGSSVGADRNIWEPGQLESNLTTAAADDEVFEDAEDERTQWQRLGETLKPSEYHHKSTSLSELGSYSKDEFLCVPVSDKQERHLSSSSEILPSEHSAFQDNIPPRLPHVLSEPFLSLRNIHDSNTLFSDLEKSCRFVQVKHLFRSESFLAQNKLCGSIDDCAGIAGLAAEIGVNRDHEERQDLLFSPDTHFRPIQTPNADTTMQITDSCAGNNTLSLCGKDCSHTEAAGSEEDENVLIVDGESYQLYKGGTAVQSHKSDRMASSQNTTTVMQKKFVPKFKVNTDWEKFSQTDYSSKSATSEVAVDGPAADPVLVRPAADTVLVRPAADAGLVRPANAGSQEDEGTILARLTAGISDVLQLDKNSSFGEQYPDESSHEQDSTSVLNSSRDFIEPLLPPYPMNLSHTEISNLWAEGEVDVSEEYSNGVSNSLVHYKNIWSVGDSFDCIGSLPASLPSVPDLDQTRLYADVSTTADEDSWDVTTPRNVSDTMTVDGTVNSNDDRCSRSWAAYDMGEEQMFAFDFELGGGQADGLAWYSSDLEGEWLSSDMPFEVQVPRKKRQKQGAYKKPCSFFLEGQCRRSDCKFAHDTSNITCRFWEEGDCFKGITCPFLHGYPSKNLHTVETLKSGDFCLETEDFPELSKSQEELMVKVTSKPVKKRLSKKTSFTVQNTAKDKESPSMGFGSTNHSLKKSANREKSRAKSLPIEIKHKK